LDKVEEIVLPRVSLPLAYRYQPPSATPAAVPGASTASSGANGKPKETSASVPSAAISASDVAIAAAARAMAAAHMDIPSRGSFTTEFPVTTNYDPFTSSSSTTVSSSGFDFFPSSNAAFTPSTAATATGTGHGNDDSLFAPSTADWGFSPSSVPMEEKNLETSFTPSVVNDPFAPTVPTTTTSNPALAKLEGYDLTLLIKENILSSEKAGQLMKMECSGTISAQLTSSFKEDTESPFDLLVSLDVSDSAKSAGGPAMMEKVQINPEVKVTVANNNGSQYQFALQNKQFPPTAATATTTTMANSAGLQLVSYKLSSDAIRPRIQSLFKVKTKVQLHPQQGLGRAVIRLIFHPLIHSKAVDSEKSSVSALHDVRVQVALNAIAAKMEESMGMEVMGMKPTTGHYDTNKKIVTWLLSNDLFANPSTAQQAAVTIDVEIHMKFPKLSTASAEVAAPLVQELSTLVLPVNIKGIYEEILISELDAHASVSLRPSSTSGGANVDGIKKFVKVFKSTQLEERFQ
jgi:hypothetical protein